MRANSALRKPSARLARLRGSGPSGGGDAESPGGTTSGGPAPRPGAVDRFDRCPVGLDSRLIARIGRSALTVSRHFPEPSPSDPDRPAAPPDSRSAAVYVRDPPSGTVAVAPAPGDSPSSSTPTIDTSDGSFPGFTSRSRLTCLSLLPGLNVATRCRSSSRGAVSCIAVRNPSAVRMYDSTSMSRPLESSSRQWPSPAPVCPDRPFPGLPRSRSPELKCTVSSTPSVRVSGPRAIPFSSNARIETSPARPERLTTRTNPCRRFGSDTAGNSGTACEPAPPPSGAVDRFVRCPARLDSRLIATTGRSDSTTSRHFPEPSPIEPDRPSAAPDSNSAAVYVRDPPAGTVALAPTPGDAPSSSTPAIDTSAASPPGFASRSRLTRLRLLPGLKIATRWRLPSTGAAS